MTATPQPAGANLGQYDASGLRSVTARAAEEHTAALWPSVRVEPLGEWSLRWESCADVPPLKRANSCLAMGRPATPVPEALARVADFYAARQRRPLVQVEHGSAIETDVAATGWVPAQGDSLFLMASAARTRGRLPDPADVAVEVDGPHAAASIRDGADELASGAVGLDGEWLGIHSLYVRPEQRRRGLARRVLTGLLDWGTQAGARTVWLHVETTNKPALTLYQHLGFTLHHQCRYYTPGPHWVTR